MGVGHGPGRRRAGLLPCRSARDRGVHDVLARRPPWRSPPSPRLTTKVAAGPWIRLYSFSSLAVLNAQLQSVLSLETYAKTSDDSAAATLASQMEQAAAASVSRFDTGYWTYYSLGGSPTPLSYQKFIVQLLHRLAPDDARFAAAAARFAAYLRQPPAFKLASSLPVGFLGGFRRKAARRRRAMLSSLRTQGGRIAVRATEDVAQRASIVRRGKARLRFPRRRSSAGRAHHS